MSRARQPQTSLTTAVIIPFPGYRQRADAKSGALRDSPEFKAGFEFAMLLVKSLKARGLLNSGSVR